MAERKQGSERFSVLLVDDEEEFAYMLGVALGRAGYRVRKAGGGEEALGMLAKEPADFIVSDLKMRGMDGFELLGKLRSQHQSSTVVMMTAFGSPDLAVEAVRRGAYDYIPKPFKPEELVLLLRKAGERERLRRENRMLRDELKGPGSFHGMVGRSAAIRRVFDLVSRVAPLKSTVLVTGESGTGKELVAKALHACSPRHNGNMVALNCAAIPATLLESELFGYAKGAFTDAQKTKRGLFEEASGGTLFFDEIGEMPMELQTKLLRVIEEGKVRRVGDTVPMDVDTRVVAATTRDLRAQSGAGRFREELFFRLNVFPIHVPSLRERREDINLLVSHFITQGSLLMGRDAPAVSSSAMRALLDYDWPGNVRELMNAVERALVLCEGTEILPEHLPAEVLAGSGIKHEGGAGELNLGVAVKAMEKDFIARALHQTGGNRTRAAEILGVSLRALMYKIKEYGLEGAGRPAG